jgi:WD40 repeat protein
VETICLWNAMTGAARGSLERTSLTFSVLAFSPDSRLLTSASYDTAVHLRNAKTGAACGVLEGHSDDVWTIAFAPDSQLLASAAEDKTIWLWNPSSRTQLAMFCLDSWTKLLSFSSDGFFLQTDVGPIPTRPCTFIGLISGYGIDNH